MPSTTPTASMLAPRTAVMKTGSSPWTSSEERSMHSETKPRAQTVRGSLFILRMRDYMKPESPLSARAAVRALTASKIRELVNEGLDNPDVLPFWVGEPDQPTPQFIRQAGIDSIQAGEVFYTHNLGIPELREAVAGYLSRLHRKTSFEEVAITSSGVNALMLASQLLVEPGDRVVEVVPLWPNLVEIPKILGAQVETVALDFSQSGWT